MRPDLKVVAARKVKKELTPSYESYSRKNAVYDSINQHGACDGKYGEPEFGIKTRQQSQKEKMSFHPVFRLLPPPHSSFLPQEPTIPARKLGRGEPSSSPVGSAMIFPKFKLRLVRR